MKVLITGANGFLGSHIARKAIHSRGWDARLMILRGSSERVLDEFVQGGERVYGNILEPETLRAAMDGVDVVFHTAGSILEWASPEDKVWDINFHGVRNVCRACVDSGVKRLVHTSSASAIGSAPPGTLTDEDRIWDLWDTGLYSRSKFLGEKEVFEWGARGLDVTISCPHQILGDWDTGPSTPGRLILDFVNMGVPAYLDGASQFVDVDDAAEGHVLMAEKGRRGHRYILAGAKPVAVKEFLDHVANIAGLPPPSFKIPLVAAEIASRPIQWASDYVTRKYPLMTIGNARMLRKNMAADIGKARRDLGFDPGDWKAAVEKAVRWFAANGYFKRNLPALKN